MKPDSDLCLRVATYLATVKGVGPLEDPFAADDPDLTRGAPQGRQTQRRTITTLRTPQKQETRTLKGVRALPMSRDITLVAGIGFEPMTFGL